MSKVICDICGTSYPETSTQCPICGCVRSADSPVVEDTDRETGGYTYVKGGRFSKSNVRKRNQGTSTAKKDKKPANKKTIGLIIVLVCLILIVSFMIVYILSSWSKRQDQNTNTPQTETTPVGCTGLTLSKLELELTASGDIWLLEATPEPADTTDTVSFSSSNEEVATVSKTGKITCVGEGHAVITVTCGNQTAECKVSCTFETTTEMPTVEPEGVRLNRKSITADYKGFTWILYSGDIPMDDIVWTSDDPAVATVKNGIVTAVAEGTTTVHAEYNGVTSSCEIVCTFDQPTIPDENGEGGSGNSGATSGTPGGKYVLYSNFGNALAYNEDLKAYDVTVKVGESVGLYLKNESGDELELDWTITEGDSCTVDKNYATVQSSKTNCMLTTEYDGVTYYCYIRTVN